MHSSRAQRRGRRPLVTIAALATIGLGCSSDAGAGLPTVGPTLVPLVTTSTVASTTSTTSTTTSTTTTTLPPSTTSTSTTTTSTTLPPTTTTTIVTEGAIVLVANATDVPGAASRLGEQLRDRGFTVADATNAAGNEEKLDVSRIYFLPAGEAVARSVSILMLGLPVDPMPVPASIVGATAALGDATVLVMLGKDLAGKRFPGS